MAEAKLNPPVDDYAD